MIERLLETWLSRANERSFQIPFCHALAADGYAVVHLSRHCAMELGKDVLAVAPDGVPCAYQLKGVDGGGRLSLSKWREDLGQQVHALVNTAPLHPALPQDRPHRAYVVLNGDIDEEVQAEINQFNEMNRRSGLPDRRLEVIVRGQLFQRFRALQSDFWATNLNDLKTYLELLTEDGRGPLPREKLAGLFETALPFWPRDGRPPSAGECGRAAAGAAIICASAVSPFTNAGNHVAEFEAWTLFWGHVLGLAERWRPPEAALRFALHIAEEAMYTSLARLCDELMDRRHYVEGDVTTDVVVYRVRMTHVLGLMGVYGLWRRQRVRAGLEPPDEARDRFLRTLFEGRRKAIWLWGEYAVPQIVAHTLFLRTIDATPAADAILLALVEGIAAQNRPGGVRPLANPYYDAEAVLPHAVGLEDEPLRDSFAGSSYMLEGLLHLFVRANYKVRTSWAFPAVTRIGLRSYTPEEPWQFYLFRNRGRGTDHQRFLRPPHRWTDLRALADECEGKGLPERVKAHPLQYLCFILTLPHRATADGLRWVASRLEGM